MPETPQPIVIAGLPKDKLNTLPNTISDLEQEPKTETFNNRMFYTDADPVIEPPKLGGYIFRKKLVEALSPWVQSILNKTFPNVGEDTTGPGEFQVLDLGCGNGLGPRIVSDQFKANALGQNIQYVFRGIDSSKAALATVTPEIRKSNLARNISLELGNIESIPNVQDNSTHLAIFFGVLPFVDNQSFSKIIAELHRVLAPGGIVWVINGMPDIESINQLGSLDYGYVMFEKSDNPDCVNEFYFNNAGDNPYETKFFSRNIPTEMANDGFDLVLQEKSIFTEEVKKAGNGFWDNGKVGEPAGYGAMIFQKPKVSPVEIPDPNRSQQIQTILRNEATQDREFALSNFNISVLPNVFPPRLFMEKIIEDISNIIPDKDAKVLEIGVGTGYLSLGLALNGFKNITGTDINSKALENTKLNFAANEKQIELIKSDLFANLEGRRFDVIFWNHPFHPVPNDITEMFDNGGFDKNFTSLDRYLKQAQNFLNKEGKLLLITSDSNNNTALVNELILQNGYTVNQVGNHRLQPGESTTDLKDIRLYQLIKAQDNQ